MRNSDRCPFHCPVCLRRCRAAQPQNHRFDCHGQISAHVIEVPGSRKDGREPQWRNVTNPMQAGYLTGPSQTKAPGRAYFEERGRLI